MRITDSASLGTLVRDTRRREGLRQIDVALAAGTGDRFVRELERGKATCQLGPTLRVLQTLGIELDATPPPVDETPER